MKDDPTAKTDLSYGMSSLYKLLTDRQKEKFLSEAGAYKFNAGNDIYDISSRSRLLYCVQNGKVKEYMNLPGCERDQIIRVVGEGEYFGYRSYLAGENFSTRAVAIGPCEVVAIPLECLGLLLKSNHEVALMFIRMLATDLGHAHLKAISMTQKHLRGRLAETLLHLNSTYGLEADGSTLSIYLSREDLANMSNMSTSNAIRTLSALSSEHAIAIDGRKIKIIDEEMLRYISKLG